MSRARVLFIGTAIALALPGCVSAGVRQGESAASCARAYTFEGRWYGDHSGPRDAGLLEFGEKLGMAEHSVCNDTPNDPPDEEDLGPPVAVYEVRGLAVESGVGVDTGGKRPELFVTRDEDDKVNAEVRSFLKELRNAD